MQKHTHRHTQALTPVIHRNTTHRQVIRDTNHRRHLDPDLDSDIPRNQVPRTLRDQPRLDTDWLGRHTAHLSIRWSRLVRAVGVLRLGDRQASEAFSTKKRSYCHHHCHPLLSQNLRSPRPPSPGSLPRPHLPASQRFPKSRFTCSQSSMTLTTMRPQRRGQEPQLA